MAHFKQALTGLAAGLIIGGLVGALSYRYGVSRPVGFDDSYSIAFAAYAAVEENVLHSLSARAFYLMDEQGQFRASLTTTNGIASLTMFAGNGNIAASVHVAEDGTSGVSLYGPDVKTRLALTLVGDDASMMLFDNNEQKRLSVSIVDGIPLVSFCDANGRQRLGLVATEESSGINFFDADSIARLSLSSADGKSQGIGLYDASGMARAVVGYADESDSAGFGTYYPSGGREWHSFQDGSAAELTDTLEDQTSLQLWRPGLE